MVFYVVNIWLNGDFHVTIWCSAEVSYQLSINEGAKQTFNNDIGGALCQVGGRPCLVAHQRLSQTDIGLDPRRTAWGPKLNPHRRAALSLGARGDRDENYALS